MRNSFLKQIFFIVIAFSAVAQSTFGQLNHFIYLQTDNQQPFYIKYNNRIYSSSATGYLILSKLKNGPVEFAVGFPKSDQPEQQFKSVVDKADKGYLIKNFAEKGWGLFDLQTSMVFYALQPSTLNNGSSHVVTQSVANDPFANMLSKVTQDSTVKTVAVKKEEKIAPEPSKPVVTEKQDSIVREQKQSVSNDTVSKVSAPEMTEQTEVKESEWIKPEKSGVVQLRKFESKEGSDFVFEVAEGSGLKDTVRLFIERDTTVVQPVIIQPQIEVKADTVAVTKEEKVTSEVSEPQKTEVKKEEHVVKQETQPEIKQDIPKAEEQTQTSASLPNTNCKATANNEDFVKLRRKMANASSDESMINEAKKIFKTKCFSTAQLRNLAVLFLNDEGKYRFYDAAMLYVTDFSNFKSLSDTIQDEYYKKRFFALLPNQ